MEENKWTFLTRKFK